jgi:hypothetical protein
MRRLGVGGYGVYQRALATIDDDAAPVAEALLVVGDETTPHRGAGGHLDLSGILGAETACTE